jgi:RNA polymerase sigma factor for flagellar operon FliA
LPLLDKQDLIESALPFVRAIAKDVVAFLPREVDREDVIRYGEMGLVQAAEGFDPRYGVRFETFAYYRIKGAMYDGLRKMAWLPRKLYAKLKYEEGANGYLQNVADRELGAEGPPDPATQVTEAVGALAAIYVTSLDAGDRQEGPEDSTEAPPERSAELSEARELLRESLAGLPDAERQLLEMFYYENVTLTEAGARLGHTKSWASRMHARALERLREQLEARGLDSAPE